MSAHISNDDLMRYLAGGDTTRLQSHLDDCSVCRAEASRLVNVVGGARAAVQSVNDNDANFWARQRYGVRQRITVPQTRRPSWAMAAALAALLIVSAFMFHTQEPRQIASGENHVTSQDAQPVSDDALLSSVNEALEQDVPAALAPLQQLAYEREQAEHKTSRHN